MPTIVLDSRIERSQIASLHKYFLESTNQDLSKSALGRLTFDTLYQILLDNNLIDPLSDVEAQYYLADHFNYKMNKSKRPQLKVQDLSKSLPKKGEGITKVVDLKPNSDRVNSLLNEL